MNATEDERRLRTSTIAQAADEVGGMLCTLAEELQITPCEQFDDGALAARLWAMSERLDSARPQDEEVDPEDVVAAARLALQAGRRDSDKLNVVKGLLDCAPPTPPSNTASVKLLVDVLQALGGRFELDVSDE